MRHRTLGSHVSEALWQTVHYQAMVDEMSTSDFVRKAVQEHLERRGIVIATYEQIVGQTKLPLVTEDASHNS